MLNTPQTIIILSTASNKKYTLTSSASTLGELKEEMTNNAISYSGMTFFEGRTRTELTSNNSQIPQNAVIRLSKSEKKITSGADIACRADCQKYLKLHPSLAATIKAKEGKNWTNCSTTILIAYCNKDIANVSVASTSTKKSATIKDASKDSWLKEGLDKGYITSQQYSLLKSTCKEEPISSSDLELFER